MSSVSKYLKLTVQFLFAFLLITTPLVWSPANAELFEFPKMMFVYAVSTLIATFWLARMVVDKKLHLARTRYDLILFLFLTSQFVSTILSIHRRTSFYGYYSRFHGGLLSTITYIFLFYAFVSNFNKKDLKKIIWVLIGSLLLSVLYAFPEHFGYAFSCLSVSGNIQATCWIQDIVNRSFGTFGQPNWLAAYIITLFPLLWVMSLKKLNHKYSKIILLGFYLSQFLVFAELIFTRSKSGLLGFIASFLIFWSITLALKFKSSLIPFALSSTVIFATAFIFGTEYTPSLASLTNSFTGQSAATIQTAASPSAEPTTGTLLENGDLSIPLTQKVGTKSSTIRYIVWSGSLELLKRFPLFGTGVETFAYSYYNVRPAAHNLVSEWDFLYNKAHNEFLNFAANSGLFGLITYTLIILTFLFFVLKQSLSTRNKSSSSIQIALASGFIALAISNFFGFSTVAVGILFFLFPAISSLATSKRKSKNINQAQKIDPASKPTSLQPLQILLLVVLSLASLYLLTSIGLQLSADMSYNEAKTYEQQGLAQNALSSYQKAIQLRPQEPTFHNDYADLLAKIAYYYASQNQEDAAKRYAQQAIQESRDTLLGNPAHLSFYKTQAGVFIRLSILDPELLKNAEAILLQAIRLSPTEAKLYYNLGLIYLDLEDYDQALTMLQTAVDLKPNYEQARLELAKLFQRNQQLDQAKQQYQYILEYLNPESSPAASALKTL